MQFTTGNIIDIIMLVCFLFAIMRGWRIGLVIKLAHLAAVIASCALAHGIATILKSSVGSKFILPMLEEKAGEELEMIPYAREGISFVADSVAYYLISSICFIIALVLLYQLIKVLHIVDYVPVVGKVNKAGGAVVGFLVEFVVFYFIWTVIFNVTPQSILDQYGLTENVISHTFILQAFAR